MKADAKNSRKDAGLEDPALWASLLSTERRGVEERRDLVRMLELWGHALGASCVAIYAPAADGHALVATFGDGAVAERLAESESSADNLERVELPGRFVLLHDSDAPQEKAISAGAMLLACAAGIIRLEGKLDEQNFFAMAQGVELVALYEVGLAIASILELEPLVEELLSRALMLLEASRGALYQLQEGRYVLTRARGSALPALDAGRIEVKALLAGDGSAVAVLPGVRNVIGVAIGPTESPKGLLVVGSEEERADGFSTKDRRTLTLFANQAAIALEKVRLHELAIEKERQDRELELAAEIQQQLLPDEMPQIPGFEVLGWSRPARVVGGDYFTFRDLGEGVWALIIGDVSGKGAPAALLVSTVDAALRVMLETEPRGRRARRPSQPIRLRCFDRKQVCYDGARQPRYQSWQAGFRECRSQRWLLAPRKWASRTFGVRRIARGTSALGEICPDECRAWTWRSRLFVQ